MIEDEYTQIGAFSVHETIISGLTGWKPNYWNVLTLDTRYQIETDTHMMFRNTLERYHEDDLEGLDSALINYFVLHAAGQAIREHWRSCIYEHKKRLYEIQEANGVRCGAKKKNGQQCRARAVRGSGRCRHHGGKSTGPKTIEGKIKSLSGLPQYRRNPALLEVKRQELMADMRRETGFDE